MSDDETYERLTAKLEQLGLNRRLQKGLTISTIWSKKRAIEAIETYGVSFYVREKIEYIRYKIAKGSDWIGVYRMKKNWKDAGLSNL